MVKMKSKNTLPPISGSENTNLIVVVPNFDPIYHFLTPGAVKKWYIGSKLGGTTIEFVFSDPEIGGNVFFDFIFTIGNPPPPSR